MFLPLFAAMMLVIPLATADDAFAWTLFDSDSYEVGDMMRFAGQIDGLEHRERIIMEVERMYSSDPEVTTDFVKLYGISTNWSSFNYGIKVMEEKGWSDGIYKVTFRTDGYNDEHIIGIGEDPAKLTLHAQRTAVPINEYAMFFGIAQDSLMENPAYLSNVKVEILDSDGKLLDDGWQADRNTARSADEDRATKSVLRPAINNGLLHFTIEEDKIMDDQNIPLWENGYRFNFKVDPITYSVGETYTIKVTYDSMVVTESFTVIPTGLPGSIDALS